MSRQAVIRNDAFEAILYDRARSYSEALRKMLTRDGNSSSGMETWQKSEFSIPSVDLVIHSSEGTISPNGGALPQKLHTYHLI